VSDSDGAQQAATHFAPAERASEAELCASYEALTANAFVTSLLDGMPNVAMVLNAQRQIVAANKPLLETLGVDDPRGLLGQRPGEAVQCINASRGPGGCGTCEACRECGAVAAILKAIGADGPVEGECRIRTRGKADGGALDLRVVANRVELGGLPFVIVGLQDISADKRRRVLEHAFFHDVLNAAAGVHATATLLLDGAESAEEERELKEDACRLAQQVVDEVEVHRRLLEAERGELEPQPSTIHVPSLLAETVSLYRHQGVTRGRELRVRDAPDCSVYTDLTLLRRILGNLVKNALEATPVGGTVSIGARESGSDIIFDVHNPGAMPEEVQLQVFQRSFTTKGGSGHGIGTYSVKLFTERYLGGRVSFVSREPDGTTFTVALPVGLAP